MFITDISHQSSNPVDYRKISHFHIACSRPDPVIVEKFLKHKVKLGRRIGSKYKVWRLHTPLLIAARYNRTNVVKMLVQYDDDIDQLQEANFFVLNARCYRMIDQLAAQGIYDPTYEPVITPKGYTILQFACERGYAKLLQVLLKHNVDVNYYGGTCATPLQIAFEGRREKVIKILLDNGADPYGTTPIKDSPPLEELVTTVNIRRNDTMDSLRRYFIFVINSSIFLGQQLIE